MRYGKRYPGSEFTGRMRENTVAEKRTQDRLTPTERYRLLKLTGDEEGVKKAPSERVWQGLEEAPHSSIDFDT